MTAVPIPGGWRPRPFALVIDDRESELAVLAWGMTLPDGSAVAVGWNNGPSSAVAVCASPDRAASLFGAEISWLDTDTVHPPSP